MSNVDWLLRELLLFSGCGFLLIGLDDLVVDLIWFWHLARRPEPRVPFVATPAVDRNPVAVFVPAWQEESVIAAMLRRATTAWAGQDYMLFVGCYPNDSATLAAIDSARHPNIRRVINPQFGPTTKGDCLNVLWHGLKREEWLSRVKFRAVVLHDAEDVAHPDEIALYHHYLDQFDVVQIPVIPLQDRTSRWVSGHYIDEFGESHTRDLVVRHAIRAGMPMAGVGCAISRRAMDHVSRLGDNHPFDADSLTEDYELGLRLGAMGYSSTFVRAYSAADRSLIGVRAYFPSTPKEAIRQKVRWSVGIALLGWKRLGWHWRLQDMWMRLRDRRTIFAAILIFVAYSALIGVLTRIALALFWGEAPFPVIDQTLASIGLATLALLFWRCFIRALCVWRGYGIQEALRSVPRIFVSSFIAIAAARGAVSRYIHYLRTAHISWDKTAHVFPSDHIP